MSEADLQRAVPRFLSRIKESDGCWLWQGSKDSNGYGQIRVTRRRLVSAHRYAYWQWIGPVPDGLELDHLCRNRGCANPAHLEAVTHAENVRRGNAPLHGFKPRETCPKGHPYDEVNSGPRKDGGRACRACAREAAKRRYYAGSKP